MRTDYRYSYTSNRSCCFLSLCVCMCLFLRAKNLDFFPMVMHQRYGLIKWLKLNECQIYIQKDRWASFNTAAVEVEVSVFRLFFGLSHPSIRTHARTTNPIISFFIFSISITHRYKMSYWSSNWTQHTHTQIDEGNNNNKWMLRLCVCSLNVCMVLCVEPYGIMCVLAQFLFPFFSLSLSLFIHIWKIL